MSKEQKPFRKSCNIIKANVNSFCSLFQSRVGVRAPVHMPVIKRAKGPYLYDYDENRYIDFELSHGSLLLGHAPAQITTIMKSWLAKGYASGYPVVSHQMLSQKLNATLMGDEHKGWVWLFYNSPFEASMATVSLLDLYRKRRKGIYLSSRAEDSSFSPFQNVCIERLAVRDMNSKLLTDLDFTVVKVDKYSDGSLEAIVQRLSQTGIIVVSDEIDFAPHIHFSHHSNLLDYTDIRVFGSYLSSGIPFGCISVNKEMFFNNKEKVMNFESFRDISSFSFFLPLYIMKAIIKYLSVLQKQGGVDGLLEKSERFYNMLNTEYFDFLDGIIYFRVSGKLKRRYSNLRLELLKHCLYFPLSCDDPMNISYAHSDDLLKQSAEKINSHFDNFNR